MDIVKHGIGVEKIITRTSGEVIIDLVKDKQQNNFTKDIETTLGNAYKVSTINNVLPKIKIVKLNKDILQMEENDFIKTLCKQNKLESSVNNPTFSNNSDINNQCNGSHSDNTDKNVNKNSIHTNHIKVIKRYRTSEEFGTVIIAVSPKLHKQILKYNNVKFGWRNYRIYDHINVIRCYNCWGFNHYKYNCRREEICRICGENHNEKNCKNSVKKCVNRIKANRKLEIPYSVDHAATDTRCQSYIKILDKLETNTEVRQ